jgi:hypothetical protein
LAVIILPASHYELKRLKGIIDSEDSVPEKIELRQDEKKTKEKQKKKQKKNNKRSPSDLKYLKNITTPSVLHNLFLAKLILLTLIL